MSLHDAKIANCLPQPRPPTDLLEVHPSPEIAAPRRQVLRRRVTQVTLAVAAVAMIVSGPGAPDAPSAPPPATPAVQPATTPPDELPVGPIMRALFR